MGKTTITVPKALVIAGANAYLSGMEICIDTWGPWNGRDWHVENSYVLKPSGERDHLELQKSPTLVGSSRRWVTGFNEVRSNEISAKADGKRLKVNVFFESAGEEIKIGCINRLSDKPCAVHALKHSGQLDHAQVSVSLRPELTADQISFIDPSVNVDFDFSFDSWVLESLRELVDLFRDTNEILKEQVRKAIHRTFEDEKTLRGLAFSLNEAILDRAAEGLRPILGVRTTEFVRKNVRIVGLEDSGVSYKVQISYPDPITQNALRITSFTVVNRDDIISCPGEVRFKASINTDYAMKGKAWLENEDGSTSRALDWVTRRDETVTSSIGRRWQSNDFQPHLGWSRIAVSFEDVFGIKHIKKSRKAEFERTCSKGQGGITL